MFDKLKATIKRDTNSITAPIGKVYAELMTFIVASEADMKANEATAAALLTKNEAIKLERELAIKIKDVLMSLAGKITIPALPVTVAAPVAPVMTAEAVTNGAGVILTR